MSSQWGMKKVILAVQREFIGIQCKSDPRFIGEDQFQHWSSGKKLCEDEWNELGSSCVGTSQVASGQESTCQCRRLGFDPWVGTTPWRRKWQPTPVFLPGKSHGQRNLAGYSPWGRKESDMTEHAHTESPRKVLRWVMRVMGENIGGRVTHRYPR